MRGDYDIPGTSLKTTFDHCRDDYFGSHGLHVHVKNNLGRIASVNLHSLTIMDGSLDGKEGRLAMGWIRDNSSMLTRDAEFWRDNGAVHQ